MEALAGFLDHWKGRSWDRLGCLGSCLWHLPWTWPAGPRLLRIDLEELPQWLNPHFLVKPRTVFVLEMTQLGKARTGVALITRVWLTECDGKRRPGGEIIAVTSFPWDTSGWERQRDVSTIQPVTGPEHHPKHYQLRPQGSCFPLAPFSFIKKWDIVFVIFICLFLAVLGLHCRADFSLVTALRHTGFGRCGLWTQHLQFPDSTQWRLSSRGAQA